MASGLLTMFGGEMIGAGRAAADPVPESSGALQRPQAPLPSMAVLEQLQRLLDQVSQVVLLALAVVDLVTDVVVAVFE